MPDFGGEFDGEGSATFCGRMKKKLPDFAAWQEDECGPIELRHMPSMLQSPDIYQLQFFTRMLFSCLVDADFHEIKARAFRRGEPLFPAQLLWQRLFI